MLIRGGACLIVMHGLLDATCLLGIVQGNDPLQSSWQVRSQILTVPYFKTYAYISAGFRLFLHWLEARVLQGEAGPSRLAGTLDDEDDFEQTEHLEEKILPVHPAKASSRKQVGMFAVEALRKSMHFHNYTSAMCAAGRRA